MAASENNCRSQSYPECRMKYPFSDFIRSTRRTHGAKLISHIPSAKQWYQSVVAEVARILRFFNTYLSGFYIISFPRLRFGQDRLSLYLGLDYCLILQPSSCDIWYWRFSSFYLSPSRINPLQLLSKNNLALNPSNILDRFNHMLLLLNWLNYYLFRVSIYNILGLIFYLQCLFMVF